MEIPTKVIILHRSPLDREICADGNNRFEIPECLEAKWKIILDTPGPLELENMEERDRVA